MRGGDITAMRLPVFLFHKFLSVKFRIKRIEVFAVKLLLYEAEAFSESLVMDNLPLSQESDRIAYLGVFDKTEDIVVCRACLLFCGQILIQIGDRIPF